MHEADLRLHLSRQTDRAIRSIDLAAMARGDAEAEVRAARDAGAVAFVDVADAGSQAEAGRLVWSSRGTAGPIFSASSSGLQYALVAHWREAGLIERDPPAFPPHDPVDRLLVLSGSCSPVTAKQIETAADAGFAAIRLDVTKGTDAAAAEAEAARVLGEVVGAFERRRGAIVYAARTIDDPAFAALEDHARALGIAFGEAQAGIGAMLGRVASAGITRMGLRRIVVAGGDTSGRVLEALPVKALEVKHRLSPGAPICLCHSDDDACAGLELVLKGGQVGSPSIFIDALG